MTASDVFFYSVSIAVWVGLIVTGFLAYRVIRLLQIVTQKIEQLQVMPQAALVSALTLLSKWIRPHKGGD